MDIILHPCPLSGSVTVIPSKSQAHRLLICAALADNATTLICPQTSRDMDATAQCLCALGATIDKTAEGYHIQPIAQTPQKAVLDCHDSGSTLRFLLPIAGALGVDTLFRLGGRLPQRPLSPLWEEMERMGCSLSRPTPDTIRCQGKLKSGSYSIAGNVSSQFITGLLFAQSLIAGKTSLEITRKLESKPYVDLTKAAMDLFQAPCYHSPGTVTVEGDWSNGAFWLAAQSLGSNLTVSGLSETSVQGDRAAAKWIHELTQEKCTISAADIPDLVPILSVAAAFGHGAVFTDITRLRLKESDRIASTIAMLEALGGQAEASQDTLTVYPAKLYGGTVDSVNDHRIAMAAAIAATACTGDVVILGAECVEKSYPNFWTEYRRLGGNYEQYLR